MQSNLRWPSVVKLGLQVAWNSRGVGRWDKQIDMLRMTSDRLEQSAAERSWLRLTASYDRLYLAEFWRGHFLPHEFHGQLNRTMKTKCRRP